MNQQLQTILDIIQQNKNLTDDEKTTIIKAVKKAGSAFNISEFKLERTEKVKRTTSILLEETIEELEQKRKAVEAQNRELEIETSLEKVRARTMAMQHSNELADTASLLFQQVSKLGVKLWGCSFNIWAPGDTSFTSWWGGRDLVLKDSWYIPLTEHPIFMLFDASRKRGDEIFVVEAGDEKLATRYDYMLGLPDVGAHLQGLLKAGITFPTFQIDHIVNFSHGNVLFITYEPCPEAYDIFKRFAKVFEQTYTRFLDLQKAEAQAREAQIETAIERVRSRSMAMYKSEELADLSFELVKQVQTLGVPVWFCAFNIYDNDLKGSIEWGSNAEGVFPKYRTPREGIFLRYYKAGQRGDSLLINEIGEKECPGHYEYLSTLPIVGEQILKMKEAGVPFPTSQIDHVAFFKYGYILFITVEPAMESHEVFKRFAKVFEQTYTRFLDLQKAEAQTREAQIEAALERVRSRSMAMHKSKEMLEVIGVVSEQLQQLNLNFDTVSFAKNDQEGEFTFWTTSRGQPKPLLMEVPTLDSPVLKGIYKAQKKGITFLADVFSAKVNKEWHEHLIAYSDLKHFPPKIKGYILNAPGFARSSFLLKNIDLYVGNYRAIPFTEEENSIFNRFAHVFEQSYTRFLDLQKAEAQTREAQIETALEKVRSRSLAMQKPDELQEVVAVVAEKLQELGVIYDAGGVILCTYFPDNKDVVHWIAVDDFSTSGRYFVPYFDSPIFSEAWDSKIRGDTFFFKEFPVAAKNHFFEYAFEHSDYKHMPEDYKQHVLKADKHNLSAAWSKNSAILIPSLTGALPSDSDAEIMKRFAKVFEQAYIRFMDLQKADEHARESQIDIALERVRSRTLAMQSSEELAETSMVVFQQLVELGIAPNRLFIGIIKDKGASIEAWATNEDGSKIASQFTLQAAKNKSIKKMITGWKEDEKSLVIDMKGKELQDYFQYLNNEMNIPFIHGLEQKRRVQTIAFFSEGLIGMAAPVEQSEDSIRLLERFASVFNLTYTRFKDLKVAEAQSKKAEEDLINLQLAKKSAEKSLSELQQTQKQLIQSEKMASLGELTAGIAHEIQNPLNFVNNFSEVSGELIDEMNEEIEKGDIEEAKFIAKDIKENLEKINHHGKRADAIVKGMLQHSRSSSGTKEPTDINALVDEYLRLAYHGLRAKDKSFNSKMETDFDESLGKINIVPQDIGRVILNLITNAFYAVNEKKKSVIANYEPTVSVSTKQLKDQVIISVKDNGNGIPQKVIDKIFQPFFTTKPTGQGTGLGLSMSYDIINAHGGELKVETKDGEGSTFSIIFTNTTTQSK